MARDTAPARIAAQNRKARHDFFIEETLEAGIVLHGTEVKSLRQGGASIVESYAGPKDGELFLVNAHIPEYAGAKHFGHVPRSIYFNDRGIAKVQLGLAKGKRKLDKRETEKQRDWQRDKARLMRQKG